MRRTIKIFALILIGLLIFIGFRNGPRWVKQINENTRLSLCLNLLIGYHAAFSKALLADAEGNLQNSTAPITAEFLIQKKIISEMHYRKMLENGFTIQAVSRDASGTTPIASFINNGWEVVALKNGEILKVPPESLSK